MVVGCSWATVRVPDRVPDNEVLVCPPPVAPIVDGIVVAGAAALAVVGVVDSAREDEFGYAPMLLFTLPSLAVAGAFTASAIYGVHERSRCQQLRAQQPIRT